jgi:anti-sigma regulatory factor (Ser/Thr protein kinase)
MNVPADVSSPVWSGGGTIRAPSQVGQRGAANRLGTGAGLVPAIPHWCQDSLLELTALPAAVSRGRRHVREVLWVWKLDVLADDSELLASELLTNAGKAVSPPQRPGLLTLRLLADAERLLIEVYDHSPIDPAPRQVSDESESGRGFVLVEALAHAWGYHRFHPGLKVVWAELLTDAGPMAARRSRSGCRCPHPAGSPPAAVPAVHAGLGRRAL